MPCFLTVGARPLVQSPASSRPCETRRRPRRDITRRRRGPSQTPRVPPVPGQDQDEAVAKYLIRRALDLLRAPAAALKHEGSAAHLLGANQAFSFCGEETL
jgi:hypothetical protein